MHSEQREVRHEEIDTEIEDLDLEPCGVLCNVVNHEDVLARRQRRPGLLQLSTDVLLLGGGCPSFIVETDRDSGDRTA